ncbi:DUF2621 domain-containing protein [Sporosarcina sp. Sa2YVA2]|uniref:DUF2621 domain-containing protein n=2 Tax=Sporosarcina quadrami TaxID=2762234 RepID=A0ABR8UD36_9BACL|nr:DUF2621 domain-containing protein [Sporosarcina quadrami]
MEEVKKVQDFFMWFIFFWCIVLVGLFGIGGFFMFRKFLKVFPKADGKSTLDWEEHYVNESLHLWNDEAKSMLNELVSPVPELFRDVAKQKIGAKIGQIALEDRAKTIDFDHIIRGYIIATPKRDHNFLRKKLNSMEVDMTPYEHLF